MDLVVKEKNNFKYLDEGKGQVIVLLHGLFGVLSNWQKVIRYFSENHRVVVPILPIYDLPKAEAGLLGLLKFLERFITAMEFEKITIIGNSLGGHLGILYALHHKDKVNRLVLTGSSGLFENTMAGTYPQRGSYDFVQKKVAYTFYDPKVASKQLVDNVFEVLQSVSNCINIVYIARSAQKNNMADTLSRLTVPTLLIWGLNDTITPPMVAHDFNRLIPNSELKFIDRCCHVPMMEHPEKFNTLVDQFLTPSAS